MSADQIEDNRGYGINLRARMPLPQKSLYTLAISRDIQKIRFATLDAQN